jgi:hypothetical protein
LEPGASSGPGPTDIDLDSLRRARGPASTPWCRGSRPRRAPGAGAPCRALFLPLGRRQQMIVKQAPWTRRSAERVAECDWLALRMNTDALAPAPEAWLHGRPWAMNEIERGRAARVQQA